MKAFFKSLLQCGENTDEQMEILNNINLFSYSPATKDN